MDIFKAVGNISGELIDESAAPRRPRRGRTAASIAALAACAALALALWQPWDGSPAEAQPGTTPAGLDTPGNGVFVPASPYAGVYIPPEPMPAAGEAGMASDMIGFFIYGGRMYTQTTIYADSSLRGERLCTVTGDIDEWSGADEYVELASSIPGDVYAVNGYDPEFRLCMSHDGGIELYDCLSGITLTTGADLYSERLRLDNAVSAYCIPDAAWEQGVDARRELSLSELEPFLATLMVSDMQYWGRDSENGDIFGHGFAEAHLYLELADGSVVPLRLFENGCVMYDGSAARVCAYMPGAIFDAVFEACT